MPPFAPRTQVGTVAGSRWMSAAYTVSSATGSAEKSSTFIAIGVPGGWAVAFHRDDAVHDVQARADAAVQVGQHIRENPAVGYAACPAALLTPVMQPYRFLTAPVMRSSAWVFILQMLIIASASCTPLQR